MLHESLRLIRCSWEPGEPLRPVKAIEKVRVSEDGLYRYFVKWGHKTPSGADWPRGEFISEKPFQQPAFDAWKASAEGTAMIAAAAPVPPSPPVPEYLVSHLRSAGLIPEEEPSGRPIKKLKK